jgi:DNA-binding MarR family transcriptional regulator
MTNGSSPPPGEGNRLGSDFSLAAVLFHQAVAEKTGLNVTDYKCLGTVLQHQPVTPGQLARIVGLSGAAMTTVLDRLERSGFVRRAPDPNDRRRLLVIADMARVEREVTPHLASFLASMGKLFARYEPEQIQLIVGFLTEMTELFKSETRKLRSGSAENR